MVSAAALLQRVVLGREGGKDGGLLLWPSCCLWKRGDSVKEVSITLPAVLFFFR